MKKSNQIPFHNKTLCSKTKWYAVDTTSPEVRNGREAAVPEKETKILENGARGARASPEQNETPVPGLSNAL